MYVGLELDDAQRIGGGGGVGAEGALLVAHPQLVALRQRRPVMQLALEQSLHVANLAREGGRDRLHACKGAALERAVAHRQRRPQLGRDAVGDVVKA